MDLVKILLLPVISVCVFLLPFSFALGLILAQTVFLVFKRIPINDFFRDVRFFLFYLLLFYFLAVIQNFFSLIFIDEMSFTKALFASVKNEFLFLSFINKF